MKYFSRTMLKQLNLFNVVTHYFILNS